MCFFGTRWVDLSINICSRLYFTRSVVKKKHVDYLHSIKNVTCRSQDEWQNLRIFHVHYILIFLSPICLSFGLSGWKIFCCLQRIVTFVTAWTKSLWSPKLLRKSKNPKTHQKPSKTFGFWQKLSTHGQNTKNPGFLTTLIWIKLYKLFYSCPFVSYLYIGIGNTFIKMGKFQSIKTK